MSIKSELTLDDLKFIQLCPGRPTRIPIVPSGVGSFSLASSRFRQSRHAEKPRFGLRSEMHSRSAALQVGH